MKNEHVWTPSGTDITKRWRKEYNWVPPSEDPEYQKKWKQAQEIHLHKEDLLFNQNERLNG
jgi:hypothetical protein